MLYFALIIARSGWDLPPRDRISMDQSPRMISIRCVWHHFLFHPFLTYWVSWLDRHSQGCLKYLIHPPNRQVSCGTPHEYGAWYIRYCHPRILQAITNAATQTFSYFLFWYFLVQRNFRARTINRLQNYSPPANFGGCIAIGVLTSNISPNGPGLG